MPRALRPLWLAASISTVGDAINLIALMWLVYDITQSPTATGLVGMAQYLPSVLIGVYAGAWIDRVSRKSVMLWTSALHVVLVAAIPLLYLVGELNGFRLGALAFAIATCTVFFNPARDAIQPQLVEKEKLLGTTSVMQGTYGLAYFFGPALGTLLLPLVGISGLFFVDSLCYAAAFVLILFVRPRRMSAAPTSENAWTLMKEGLHYVKRNPLAWGLLLVTAVDNLFIMGPAIVGASIYVRKELGAGAAAYAAVEAAFALGVLAGSVLVHRYGKKLPRGKTLLYALVWDGVTFIPFYWIDSLFINTIWWFIHSVGIAFILVPRTNLVQTEIPEALQGRMFSLVQITVVGMTALSCGLTGMAADFISTRDIFLFIGVVAGLIGALGFFIRPLRVQR